MGSDSKAHVIRHVLHSLLYMENMNTYNTSYRYTLKANPKKCLPKAWIELLDTFEYHNVYSW